MMVLNPDHFRLDPNAGYMALLKRELLDAYLDERVLQVKMRTGKWWTIRRNGSTKLWKGDLSRFFIPYKYGLYGCGQITEADMVALPVILADAKCLYCDWNGGRMVTWPDVSKALDRYKDWIDPPGRGAFKCE